MNERASAWQAANLPDREKTLPLRRAVDRNNPMNPSMSEPGGAISEERPSILPKPGEHKTITMATIAKAAGVSQGAISSLLNDRDYGIRVSEKTRDRVFKVCRELGYVPNDLRAVLRMYPHIGDTGVLVSTDYANPAMHPLVQRVVAAAMEKSTFVGKQVTLAQFDPAADYGGDPDVLPHPVNEGVVSRFLLLGAPNASLCHAIMQRGFPVASLGYELVMAGVTSFVPEYATASRIALEYLAGLGHKKIAILPGPFGTTDRAIIELNRGIKLGCDSTGLPLDSQNLLYGDLTYQMGADAVDAILSRDAKPTALLCLSDIAAAGAIARAASKGIKTSTLSIMGCGDDAIGGLLHPKLTTVRMPVEEMTAAALDDADVRLGTEDMATSRTQVFPVSVVERDSCKAPKAV